MFPEPARTPVAAVVVQEQRSTSRLVAFGLLGGAGGLVAGGLLGAVIGGNGEDDPDEEWIEALYGSAIGGTIGESIGLATGVHFANNRRGNWAIGSLVSLAIGGLGVKLAYENQDAPEAPIILSATVIAQLLATIAIERR
jgi:hypothetical protein